MNSTARGNSLYNYHTIENVDFSGVLNQVYIANAKQPSQVLQEPKPPPPLKVLI